MTRILKRLVNNMTTLTNERLEDIASFAVSSELISMANELLSLRAQLAELEKQEPVAWIVGSEEIDEFKRGREVTVMRDGDEEELEKIALYAAPALPAASQPYTVPDERVAYESFIAKRLGGSIDTRRAKNGDPEKPDYMAWDMAVGWIAWQGRAAMLRPGQFRDATKMVQLSGNSEQVNHSVDATDMVNSSVIPKGCKLALSEAVAAIYFNDSSGYLSALFSVVKALSPEIMELFLNNEKAAFDATRLASAPQHGNSQSSISSSNSTGCGVNACNQSSKGDA